MSITAPKQTKLLGATVNGLGVVTAVSTTLAWCFCMIEDEHGVRHHRFLADLSKDDVTFPAAAQPYVTRTERISYGTWDAVYGLEPLQKALGVAA